MQRRADERSARIDERIARAEERMNRNEGGGRRPHGQMDERNSELRRHSDEVF